MTRQQRMVPARGPRGKATQIEIWPRPKNGVWDWSRCYFAPGDRVRVFTDYTPQPADYEATVAVVVVNVYGRVSYSVMTSAGEKREVMLEDVTGWRHLPIDYRHHQTMRQLRAQEAGRHDTRLIFPKRRRAR